MAMALIISSSLVFKEQVPNSSMANLKRVSDAMTVKFLGLTIVTAFGLLVIVGPKLSATSSSGIGDVGSGNCYAASKGPSTPTLCE